MEPEEYLATDGPEALGYTSEGLAPASPGELAAPDRAGAHAVPLAASIDSPWWTRTPVLLGVAAILLVVYGTQARHGPALADEHVYLAGARYFSETGSLNARYYDYDAILKQGHPHQDAHSPGYVLILGAAMVLSREGYWTAVALNALAYVAGALLLRSLSRSLGLGERQASLAAALYLVLPVLLPYVFWVMPSLVLAMLFIAALACAARFGHRVPGALLAAIAFGAALLVRETAVFGLPALLALIWRRGRIVPFLGGLVGFVLLVYLPLNADRAGGADIWRLPWGARAAAQATKAVRQGDVARAAAIVAERARWNLEQLTGEETPWAEKGTLGMYALLVLAATLGRRRHGAEMRIFHAGLVVGWLALVAILLALYVIVWWDGFRFLMTLMPAFVPVVVSTLAAGSVSFWRLSALGIGVLSVAVDAGMLAAVNEYKISRQKRWDGISSYVERYLAGAPLFRVVLQNGWVLGLRRYPVEVVSSVPKTGGEIRALEQAVWFDYLVLPGDSPLAEEMAGRARFRRVNDDDPQPPLLIYRRRK